MGQNFLFCDRDQELLLPPSLREWLPEDHLAWFVLDAVAELDLSAFYAAYRQDGWGAAAHDPQMMVALLLYAYAVGERSSRAIEHRLHEDVAFRVIASNQAPDHATIARFRVRHQDQLAQLFSQVLWLCAKAGLVRSGVVAVDGTRVQANASREATRSYEQIAREVLAEADTVDAAEDERFGDRRGDELPPQLADSRSRRDWLREAKRQLDAEQAERGQPSARPARLAEAKRRLEEQLQTERRTVEGFAAWRERRVADVGAQKAGRAPEPYRPAQRPQGTINTTDLDSHMVKGLRGWLQGYTAQAVAAEDQILVAADVIASGNERQRLEPMVEQAGEELGRAGVSQRPEVVLADAGFWNAGQIEHLAERGLQVLVTPDASGRKQPSAIRRRPAYERMRAALASEEGRALYRRRAQMIEPIFAQTKKVRRADRFQRRGLPACRSEWRLIAATHNLLKLWRSRPAPMLA